MQEGENWEQDGAWITVRQCSRTAVLGLSQSPRHRLGGTWRGVGVPQKPWDSVGLKRGRIQRQALQESPVTSASHVQVHGLPQEHVQPSSHGHITPLLPSKQPPLPQPLLPPSIRGPAAPPAGPQLPGCPLMAAARLGQGLGRDNLRHPLHALTLSKQ